MNKLRKPKNGNLLKIGPKQPRRRVARGGDDLPYDVSGLKDRKINVKLKLFEVDNTLKMEPITIVVSKKKALTMTIYDLIASFINNVKNGTYQGKFTSPIYREDFKGIEVVICDIGAQESEESYPTEYASVLSLNDMMTRTIADPYGFLQMSELSVYNRNFFKNNPESLLETEQILPLEYWHVCGFMIKDTGYYSNLMDICPFLVGGTVYSDKSGKLTQEQASDRRDIYNGLYAFVIETMMRYFRKHLYYDSMDEDLYSTILDINMTSDKNISLLIRKMLMGSFKSYGPIKPLYKNYCIPDNMIIPWSKLANIPRNTLSNPQQFIDIHENFAKTLRGYTNLKEYSVSNEYLLTIFKENADDLKKLLSCIDERAGERTESRFELTNEFETLVTNKLLQEIMFANFGKKDPGKKFMLVRVPLVVSFKYISIATEDTRWGFIESFVKHLGENRFDTKNVVNNLDESSNMVLWAPCLIPLSEDSENTDEVNTKDTLRKLMSLVKIPTFREHPDLDMIAKLSTTDFEKAKYGYLGPNYPIKWLTRFSDINDAEEKRIQLHYLPVNLANISSAHEMFLRKSQKEYYVNSMTGEAISGYGADLSTSSYKTPLSSTKMNWKYMNSSDNVKYERITEPTEIPQLDEHTSYITKHFMPKILIGYTLELPFANTKYKSFSPEEVELYNDVYDKNVDDIEDYVYDNDEDFVKVTGSTTVDVDAEDIIKKALHVFCGDKRFSADSDVVKTTRQRIDHGLQILSVKQYLEMFEKADQMGMLAKDSPHFIFSEIESIYREIDGNDAPSQSLIFEEEEEIGTDGSTLFSERMATKSDFWMKTNHYEPLNLPDGFKPRDFQFTMDIDK